MPDLTPSERVLRARIGGHSKWAKTGDRTAATATARQAFLNRFEKQVDPEGVLDPAERARRAESARKAHFTRLALRSSQARRAADLLAVSPSTVWIRRVPGRR